MAVRGRAQSISTKGSDVIGMRSSTSGGSSTTDTAESTT